MKKTLIALAMASAMAATAANAEVTVYGSVEQRVEMTDGVWDVNGDDNYVGFEASEDLGNGASAYANISMDVASEDNSTATVRDGYVGVNFGAVDVRAGRQINFLDAADDSTTDIFEGTSLTADGAGRVDSAVRVTATMSGVTVGGVVISDNAGAEEKTDAYQVMASAAVGPVTVLGVYNKDKNADTDTKLFGASTSVADFAVAGTYEIAANDDYTATVVASLDLGNNTLKGGYETIENGVDTYVVEVVHNFSKSTSAYVNYSDNDAADSDPTTMIGLRHNF